MSTSQNDYDDLKIVISRVDDICKFLNNLKKTNRNIKERLDDLESNNANQEQRILDSERKIIELQKVETTHGKVEEISEGLQRVENTADTNKEKIEKLHTKIKENIIKVSKEQDVDEKHFSEKHFELEKVTKKMQCENKSLQQGIHDLDVQISKLDTEYKLIRCAMDLNQSSLEETMKKVMKLESEKVPIKIKSPTNEHLLMSNDSKC